MSDFPSLRSLSLLALASIGFLSACDQLTVVDKVNDPESKWDDFYRSSKNLKAINATVGQVDGVPKQVVRLSSRLGRVDPERMTIIGIKISGAPNVLKRYVKLYFTDGGQEEGVLVETKQGLYAPIQIRWIPNRQIYQRLKRHDDLQPNAATGLKWVHPQFENAKINLCVGRVTAQGLPEEFPYQAWAYCNDPKSKKDLTPRYMPIWRDTAWGT